MKLKYHELAYMLFFAFTFGFRAIGGHEGWGTYKYCLLIGCAFFLLKLLSCPHRIGEYLLILLILSEGLIVYSQTGEKGLFLCFLMMAGMKDMSERRLFRMAAVLLGGAMAVLVFLSVFGFLPDVRFGPTVGRHAWAIVRRSLGYPHTNTLLTTYIIWMMLILYLVGNSSRKKVLAVSLLLYTGALYLYLYCDSTTGLLISTGYLVLNWVMQFHAKYRKWEVALIYVLYPIINLLVFLMSFLFCEEWMQAGRLLSFAHRFKLSNYYFSHYPLSAFGVYIPIPPDRYGIDVSQVYLLLNLGLVSFVMVSLLYLLVLREMIHRKNGGALAIILVLMIMGISDPMLYNLSCKNLTFIFMGVALFACSERFRRRLPDWMDREICVIRAGDEEVPEALKSGVTKCGELFRSLIRILCGNRMIPAVSAMIAVAAAVFYAILFRSAIRSIGGSYSAGVYEYFRMSCSVGFWSFLFCVIPAALLFFRRRR